MIVVDAMGNGDVRNIKEAIAICAYGDTILIQPGVYEEVLDVRNKGLSLVGTDRNKCIIVNQSGKYVNAPILACGNFAIENLTVKMTLEKLDGWYPTYDWNDIPNTVPGYAIHIDDENDISEEGITEGKISNCIFYSEAFPAAGIGINGNQTIMFANCTFIRNTNNSLFIRDKWKGAFMAHSANKKADNQHLIISGCTFKTNYGMAANFLMTLAGERKATLTAINNVFVSDQIKGNDCVEYMKGKSILSSESKGNNVEMLNSPSRKVFLILKGRIGNQLFQYAIAKQIEKQLGNNTSLIVDESEVLDLKWINSLRDYDLGTIEYVDDRKLLKTKEFIIPYAALCLYYRFIYSRRYMTKYKLEKIFGPILNHMGLIAVENGYMPYQLPKKRNVIVYGFFQSEQYFSKIRDDIRKMFNLTKKLEESQYPHLEEIENRNTVCISIKVEHNVDFPMYNVCDNSYWENAIKYITQKVDNPLFFVCSDNVDYVKENLIDCTKYDVVCQAKEFSASLSLAAMSKCKHFIIGNTTFGWWAQYLSDYKDKIVVAPKKWMNIEMPIGIYDGQEKWYLM